MEKGGENKSTKEGHRDTLAHVVVDAVAGERVGEGRGG